MQAIITEYHGPTNHCGPFIDAKCKAGRRTIAYNPKLSLETNHQRAAEQLQTLMNWIGPNYGKLHGGQLPNEEYVWVMVSDRGVNS